MSELCADQPLFENENFIDMRHATASFKPKHRARCIDA